MKKLHKIRTFDELLLAKEKTRYAMLVHEREISANVDAVKYEMISYFKGTLYEIGQRIVSYLIIKLVKK